MPLLKVQLDILIFLAELHLKLIEDVLSAHVEVDVGGLLQISLQVNNFLQLNLVVLVRDNLL